MTTLLDTGAAVAACFLFFLAGVVVGGRRQRARQALHAIANGQPPACPHCRLPMRIASPDEFVGGTQSFVLAALHCASVRCPGEQEARPRHAP